MGKNEKLGDTVADFVAVPGSAEAKRTPDEWAALKFPGTPDRLHPSAWKHGAATALHRWAFHAHHYGAILLSESDYDAAIEAASHLDPKTGASMPHKAALGKLA